MSEPVDYAALLSGVPQREDSLLPALHRIQNSEGFISPAAVEFTARYLNLSRAQVYGVVSYYHHFRTTPPANLCVQVCVAEACQSRGAAQVLQGALSLSRENDDIEIEPVFCLGQCALGPSVLVNDELHLHMNPQRLAELARAASRTGETS